MSSGNASMTTGQFRELAGAVLRTIPDDLDPTVAQKWIENQEELRDALRQALKSGGCFLFVNYDESVEDAVKAGHYDWVSSNINSHNFSTTQKGSRRVEMKLIHFDRVISTEEALRELDRMGYRPSELHELLAFGRDHPEIQRKFPIIGLGAAWRDGRGDARVPYLGRCGSKRGLYLNWLENDWPEICRFAALSK
jgi:hypothetical protein